MSHDRRMIGRNRERGSAMLVTLIVIASLLAGAAVLVSMQLASNGAADVTRSATAALHCAEAGLAAARPAVITNAGQWNAALAAGTQPTWLNASAIDHDLDDNDSVTTDDFTITLVDNEDEGTGSNNGAVDNDLSVFIVSRCTKYPETPKEVRELITYSGAGKCYNAQKGGCGKNNNSGTL
jgi:hypothetical protein